MNHRPVVIGIRGRAGAGKTTLANFIVDQFEPRHGWIRYSLADPIRRALKMAGITKEAQPELYRGLAQMIGAMARARDADHWVKMYKKWFHMVALANTAPYTQFVVIDDIRYENELRECDITVFVEPMFDLPPLPAGCEMHESELLAIQGPRAGDYVMYNNKTQLGTEKAAREIIERAKGIQSSISAMKEIYAGS